MAAEPTETGSGTDDPGAPAAAKAKSGLTLTALLAIAASAGGAAFAGEWLRPAPAAPAALAFAEGGAAATACAGEADASSRGWSHDEIDFVAIDDLTVSIGRAPSARFVKLDLSLMVRNGRAGDAADAKPLLIDTFGTYLRALEPSRLEDPGFYPEMREQLSRRAELVLGADTAQGVLITSFMVR